MFSNNIVFAAENELNTANIIEEDIQVTSSNEEKNIEEEVKLIIKSQKDELNSIQNDIKLASINGLFALLGVVVGFVGVYINNKLAYTKAKKEYIYKILLEKYEELSKLYDKYKDLEIEIITFDIEEIIESMYTYTNQEDIFSNDLSLYNELLKKIKEISEIQDKVMKFVSDNTIILHKNIKIDIYKEWKNVLGNYKLDFYSKFADLKCIKHRKSKLEIIENKNAFVSDIEKGVKATFNIKIAIEEKLF